MFFYKPIYQDSIIPSKTFVHLCLCLSPSLPLCLYAHHSDTVIRAMCFNVPSKRIKQYLVKFATEY